MATGKLGVVGEHDWLAVTLQANQAYLFTVTGLTGDGTVEVLPASLGGDNFAVNSVITPGATAATENVWLTPTTAGTYYVDISDPNTIGNYSVSAVTEPNDFPDNTTTTGIVTVMCFVGGTRIATQRGEMPVERLSIGDAVLTASGEARPIVWIGTGRVLATRGRRNAATPVIVRKGALADNVPYRDLHVTKGHSLYIDGVLIPVEFLVNHRSILWDDRAQEVEVYHIELETHDVLIADGAPAESYRDDGNRWLFKNANSGWDLPPQVPFAPVLTGGQVVDAIWRRLLDRAGPRPGIPLTDDPDLCLLVGHHRLDAVERSGEAHVFRLHLPAVPVKVRIASRAGAPQELGFARDPRCLGVALRQIVLRQAAEVQVTDAADERLADGFHAFEVDSGIRWTDGDAVIPEELFGGFTGSVELVLHVGGATHYPADFPIQCVA